jgi:hypothetical protein
LAGWDGFYGGNMPQIKFSHKYQKILNCHNDVIDTATLLQVIPVNLEELYRKETGENPTYRKDSSDYHTLKYVTWLEAKVKELEEYSHKLLDESTYYLNQRNERNKIINDLTAKVQELERKITVLTGNPTT